MRTWKNIKLSSYVMWIFDVQLHNNDAIVTQAFFVWFILKAIFQVGDVANFFG